MSKTTDQYLEQQQKETQLPNVFKAPQLRDEATVLISQAIEKNVPVETMEKLLAMRRELRAEHAKEEYDRSMAAFQSECPTIERRKQGYNYKYAPLESIVEQVKDILSKNGFSYTFDTDNIENAVVVYCKVKHVGGHMEVSKARIDHETTTKMNSSQQSGASMTYGKRYAFVNAFGILTGDEDTDAATPHDTYKTREKLPEIETPAPTGVYPIVAFQIKDIERLKKEKNISDEIFDDILAKFHVSEISKLSAAAAKKIIEKLSSLPAPKPDFKFKKPEELELTEPQ